MSMSAQGGYAINAWSDGAVREYCSPCESRSCGSDIVAEISRHKFGRHPVSAEFAGMFTLWRVEWGKATRRKWGSKSREKALRRVDANGRIHAARLRSEIGPGPVIVYCDEFRDPCGGPCEWKVTDLGELIPYWHRPIAGYVIDLEVCGEWAWEYRPAGKYMIGSPVGECDWWRGEPALPRELVMAFNAWHGEWSQAAWSGDAHCDAFDWEAFHVKGLALARRLKQVVGAGYKVIYLRPYEEPNKEEGGRVLEVRLDGATRDYQHKPYWSGSEWSRLGLA